MDKVKSFFVAIGMWCAYAGIAIAKWFKNWVVVVDGKDIIPVRIGRWFANWVVPDKDGARVLGKFVRSDSGKSISASVVAAMLGLIIALILMMCIDITKSFQGFGTILLGGFKSTKEMGRMLYRATPILMTGLSVGFAFKTGLFNIGSTGQFTVGLFMSVFCAFYISDYWLVCLLFGMLGGMVWGFIPGIFKALFNVNEVITCIMTNYIGMYLVNLLIMSSPLMYSQTYNRTNALPVASNIPNWGLESIFGANSYVGGAFIIAVGVAILVHVLLNKTTLGYELKACGMNKDAARYAGVNHKSRIVLSMVVAGGLAGLGGAMFIQAGVGDTYSTSNALVGEGFTGIAVALLGTSNPIGVIFAAIFFAHLESGGLSLQAVGFKPEIIDVIIGVIIYFCAFVMLFKGFITKRFTLKGRSVEGAAVIEGAPSTEDGSVADGDASEEVEQ